MKKPHRLSGRWMIMIVAARSMDASEVVVRKQKERVR
jgi:hypothetical protein